MKIIREALSILRMRVSRRVQRGNLIANIERGDHKLAEMFRDAIELGTCECCVAAFYGGFDGKYMQLERKQARRREWLAILEAKIGGAR